MYTSETTTINDENILRKSHNIPPYAHIQFFFISKHKSKHGKFVNVLICTRFYPQFAKARVQQFECSSSAYILSIFKCKTQVSETKNREQQISV